MFKHELHVVPGNLQHLQLSTSPVMSSYPLAKECQLERRGFSWQLLLGCAGVWQHVKTVLPGSAKPTRASSRSLLGRIMMGLTLTYVFSTMHMQAATTYTRAFEIPSTGGLPLGRTLQKKSSTTFTMSWMHGLVPKSAEVFFATSISV